MSVCGSYDLNSLKMHAYNKILLSSHPLEWQELKTKTKKQETSVGVDVEKLDPYAWLVKM